MDLIGKWYNASNQSFLLPITLKRLRKPRYVSTEKETIEFCAWCGRSLHQQQYTDSKVLTRGTCLSCIKKMKLFPHDNLNDNPEVLKAQAQDEWLDEYPYGTIVIDADDLVIKYNKAESQMSGLDPKDVEGKNFFRDIAPCTAVKEFKGVLDQLRSGDTDGQESIKFTFDHRNFYAFVSILMTYLNGPEITVLSIKKVEEDVTNFGRH